jgi:hypothetical protein
MEDEAVVVLADQGRVKVLNEVGARIWALADGSRTVHEIISTLRAEYEADPQEIEKDALAFLETLADQGALSFSPEAAPHGQDDSPSG